MGILSILYLELSSVALLKEERSGILGMQMFVTAFCYQLTLIFMHRGTGPSPRSNHVAALYDDRILFIFGGASKSRILNDLYSIDFETVCSGLAVFFLVDISWLSCECLEI